MEENTIDFEGNADVKPAGNANENPANQEDVTGLNGDTVADVTGKDNTTNQVQDNDNKVEDDNTNENSSTGELEVGTEVEFDGNIYTVADNGDLVDKDGKVFKSAKDVDKWLKENNASDSTDNEPLSFASIKEAVGIDVLDNNGNSIEFTDDAEGVKNYVDSVIALKAKDIQEGAINKLFTEIPLVKQFIDYLQVNGTPRGFGDIPDRSGIQLDKDNSAQLEAVIRMAAKEFGNKSLNETYIKYLRESGSLYDEARNQLDALVGKDKAYRKELEAQAKAAREQEQREINEYWQGVSDTIAKRVIGGYKLPDSFVKEVNGQKITLTPDDFYSYVADAIVDEESGNRMTGYQRDLNRLSNEEALNKELLDAWLMFTGGSYKDLIDMAVKEDKVRRLIIKSKEQRSTRTIKVNKPTQSKVNPDDIVLS